MDRRHFLKDLGAMGAGVLALTSPWLTTFASADATVGHRLRLGLIGPGSRGRFLLSFLVQNPKCDVVAFADIYQPSLDEALKMVPTAKTYHDYRRLLDDPSIDAVVIATPLNTHYQIALDAFDADAADFALSGCAGIADVGVDNLILRKSLTGCACQHSQHHDYSIGEFHLYSSFSTCSSVLP